ncbi:hypothetical protein BpHYR1_041039 [Brachionus plicatilis]|uniref:Uncharacterized protein n=1 Tax=Brachionus plicatilis TaxID=10195 RepID=A0A3M7PZF0_BRAPC|nr:hypothetical protein BpHYR1_041039 [Brachionus plicatilis]
MTTGHQLYKTLTFFTTARLACRGVLHERSPMNGSLGTRPEGVVSVLELVYRGGVDDRGRQGVSFINHSVRECIGSL